MHIDDVAHYYSNHNDSVVRLVIDGFNIAFYQGSGQPWVERDDTDCYGDSVSIRVPLTEALDYILEWWGGQMPDISNALNGESEEAEYDNGDYWDDYYEDDEDEEDDDFDLDIDEDDEDDEEEDVGEEE